MKREGAFASRKFDTVMEFGRAFYRALKPQQPADWIDVQSFLWCVCPHSYKSVPDDRAESGNERLAAEDRVEKLGAPFNQIFTSSEEGHFAFELIRIALDGLGIDATQAPHDRRIALVTRKRRGVWILRLNFGQWKILTVFAPTAGRDRLEFVCRKDLVSKFQHTEQFEFASTIRGHKYLAIQIAADTKNLGPGYCIGHSYFCVRNGTVPDVDWYRRVIQHEIVPLLQEYWFDNEQRVADQQSALLA